MVRKCFRLMIAGMLVSGLIFTVSCSHKGVKTGTDDAGTVGQASSKGGGPLTEEEAIRDEMQRAREAFENDDVYFDFDQSVLTAMAQGVLERKAAWLRGNPDAQVTIEGHCDERGTVEYNIALGERRARSAMDFLVDLGIESSRLSTVSYGEERPLDPGHNENAWALNRRAHFVIH